MMQNIQMLLSQAEETDAQRAGRLEGVAAEHGVDSVTLLSVEDDLRATLRQQTRENAGQVDKLKTLAESYAPMVGIDPEEITEEKVINLLTIYLLRSPDKTARAVRTLNTIFARNDLYDELGTEKPGAGEIPTEPDSE